MCIRDSSYSRLQDLNIFKFINIQFSEVPREFETDSFKLDVTIQLTPMDQQDVTFEAEATNTGGNLGLAGSVGYRNKNLFRNAEVLEIKVKGCLLYTSPSPRDRTRSRMPSSAWKKKKQNETDHVKVSNDTGMSDRDDRT